MNSSLRDAVSVTFPFPDRKLLWLIDSQEIRSLVISKHTSVNSINPGQQHSGDNVSAWALGPAQDLWEPSWRFQCVSRVTVISASPQVGTAAGFMALTFDPIWHLLVHLRFNPAFKPSDLTSLDKMSITHEHCPSNLPKDVYIGSLNSLE